MTKDNYANWSTEESERLAEYAYPEVPAPPNIDNVTAVSILWNEEPRTAPLLSTLAQWFTNIVVVVQESTDKTLEIAQRVLTEPTHTVVPDAWHGGGDFSMPLALSHVKTEWAFVISGDEFPDLELLRSIPSAVNVMEKGGNSGAFIEFDETIEGQPYVEHGRHVRLFRASGGWEARHHSAASHVNTIIWNTGKILHRRSLDEVVRDYLRKLSMMEQEGEHNLVRVNKTMLYRACTQTAAAYGWPYVHKYDWWPEVDRRVFADARSGLAIL